MISSIVVLKSSAIALSVSPDLTIYIPLGVADGIIPSANAVTVAFMSKVAAGVIYSKAADVSRGASRSVDDEQPIKSTSGMHTTHTCRRRALLRDMNLLQAHK
jgi:hypothetical protein